MRNLILLPIFLFLAIPLNSCNYIGEKDKVYTESSNTSQLDKANDEITKSRRNIITETVAKTSPAVAGINVTEIRQYRDPFFTPFFDDPFFRQFFGDRTSSQQVKSLGSGFLISSDGYILTNDHVAGNATEIVVTLTDGKHYNAKIIGSDPVSDVCLIKIEGEDFPFIPLGNSADVIIGEWVIALGNPFGLFDLNNKPTVTVGVISATNMNLNRVENRYYLDMIQTDASINGGNSGGPLVNSVGEVIGMNTIIFTAGSSQGSIGLGFAIPINKVKKIVDELKDEGKIDRDFNTGLTVQNIDEALAKYFKLEDTKGVIITKIRKNSSADNAGLKPGDVITKIDNFRIDNETTLIGVLQEYRTGQTIAITVMRETKPENLKMKLEKAE